MFKTLLPLLLAVFLLFLSFSRCVLLDLPLSTFIHLGYLLLYRNSRRIILLGSISWDFFGLRDFKVFCWHWQALVTLKVRIDDLSLTWWILMMMLFIRPRGPLLARSIIDGIIRRLMGKSMEYFHFLLVWDVGTQIDCQLLVMGWILSWMSQSKLRLSLALIILG